MAAANPDIISIDQSVDIVDGIKRVGSGFAIQVGEGGGGCPCFRLLKGDNMLGDYDGMGLDGMAHTARTPAATSYLSSSPCCAHDCSSATRYNTPLSLPYRVCRATWTPECCLAARM
jgi:hypothetical protein